MELIIPVLGFIMSLFMFISVYNHILSSLIALEFMVLMVFLLLATTPTLETSLSYPILLYLAIAVCEGAIGVSVIVMFSRSKTLSLMNLNNIMSW